MDIEEFRTKPSWEDYEAALLTRGFTPCFKQDEPPLPVTCCRWASVRVAQDKPTDNRAIKGMSKVLRMTGSSCVKRPLCPSVRPFFIVLSSAS